MPPAPSLQRLLRFAAIVRFGLDDDLSRIGISLPNDLATEKILADALSATVYDDGIPLPQLGVGYWHFRQIHVKDEEVCRCSGAQARRYLECPARLLPNLAQPVTQGCPLEAWKGNDQYFPVAHGCSYFRDRERIALA